MAAGIVSNGQTVSDATQQVADQAAESGKQTSNQGGNETGQGFGSGYESGVTSSGPGWRNQPQPQSATLLLGLKAWRHLVVNK